MRITWPPRFTPRCLLRPFVRGSQVTMATLSRRSFVTEGHFLRVLLAAGSCLTVFTIYDLLSSQDAGIHIICPCYEKTSTGEREARYLQQIMTEVDPLSGRSVLAALREQQPALAAEFLVAHEDQGRRCREVPGLFSVKHNNMLWQEATLGQTTMLLLTAYYDDRPHDGPMIRILGVADSPSPPTPACHLYPDLSSPTVATRAVSMDFLHWQYPLEGSWHPFMITCRAGNITSDTVSVVGHPCQPASNALRITHAPNPLFPPLDTTTLSELADIHGAESLNHSQSKSELTDNYINQGEENHRESKVMEVDIENSPKSSLLDLEGNLEIKMKHNVEDDRKLPAENKIRNKFNNNQEKKGLALCHKFIFNDLRDSSVRVAEWLEASRAWGVDHVTVYLITAHPNLLRLLQYYEQQGFLTLLPWTNPGHYPNSPALQRAFFDTQRYALFTLENFPYTDCLLRHIATHRYVAVWDMDEFLIPAEPYNSLTDMVDAAKLRWFSNHKNQCAQQFSKQYIAYENRGKTNITTINIDGMNVLNKIVDEDTDEKTIQFIDQMKFSKLDPECRSPTSYIGQCSYFFDDLEEGVTQQGVHLHMLSHVTRTMRFSPPRVFSKGIHDTSRALSLHAHFALYNLEGPVNRNSDLYTLYPPSQGYLAHYRSKCQGEDQTECDNLFRPFLTEDKRMWQHRQQITNRTIETLDILRLL